MKPSSKERPLVERLMGSLGRLLPTEIRRRIFEPACNDLVREHLTAESGRRSSWSLALRTVILVLRSMCFGLVHAVFDRKRVKRLIVGLSVFVGIVAIVGIILLRDWIGQFARY